MSHLNISKQALNDRADELLQAVERAVRQWGLAHQDERLQLSSKVLSKTQQLVLLEKFERYGDDAISDRQKTASSEKLHAVCKALVNEETFAEPSEYARLLVYFYRLFYQLLGKTIRLTPILS